jgi:hypothetical protein
MPLLEDDISDIQNSNDPTTEKISRVLEFLAKQHALGVSLTNLATALALASDNGHVYTASSILEFIALHHDVKANPRMASDA